MFGTSFGVQKEGLLLLLLLLDVPEPLIVVVFKVFKQYEKTRWMNLFILIVPMTSGVCLFKSNYVMQDDDSICDRVLFLPLFMY